MFSWPIWMVFSHSHISLRLQLAHLHATCISSGSHPCFFVSEPIQRVREGRKIPDTTDGASFVWKTKRTSSPKCERWPQLFRLQVKTVGVALTCRPQGLSIAHDKSQGDTFAAPLEPRWSYILVKCVLKVPGSGWRDKRCSLLTS